MYWFKYVCAVLIVLCNVIMIAISLSPDIFFTEEIAYLKCLVSDAFLVSCNPCTIFLFQRLIIRTVKSFEFARASFPEQVLIFKYFVVLSKITIKTMFYNFHWCLLMGNGFQGIKQLSPPPPHPRILIS